MQQHTPLPENLTTLAIDLAKDTFQIAGENQQQRIVYEQRIKSRATFARLLKQIPTHITVLMETGPGAQHYARTLKTQGNPVRIKTPEQSALRTLHNIRRRHINNNAKMPPFPPRTPPCNPSHSP